LAISQYSIRNDIARRYELLLYVPVGRNASTFCKNFLAIAYPGV